MSDESMRRTPGVNYEPDSGSDVEDFVADYAFDAIDAGVHPTAVRDALREAAEEIENRQRTGEFRDTPKRSEPADFGGGESTGVQDL
ncbi:TCP-1/cpn60 chaperonin family protein [Natronoarchaeum rubrum]|uniref:TCP-1/cpn60 chaperonin family protein n=1 Tax=Natronoarchaeum rubrum TaxID=755311 RepID=UPI0021110B93|nr:TCP-1/cpn60 chaperonin family protein [Natronoarchaeum rubrum]